MRDIYRRNPDRFRLFCPDETNSNRLGAVFEVSDRAFAERVTQDDVAILYRMAGSWKSSEAQLSRLAGGLHPDWPARLVRHLRGVRDGERLQTIQQVAEEADTRRGAKVPSLNILVTSTAWRNDHNGFSHQGPGLIQNVITQRGNVGRVYLPPDANTLLSVADHCLRSRSTVNLLIDKQPQLQWLSIDDDRPLRTRCRRLGVPNRRRHRGPRHRPGLRR